MNTVRASAFGALLALVCQLASAKVSTSAVLCFLPAVRLPSSSDETHLANFVSQSQALGDPSALFITTTASINLEPEQVSALRSQDLVAYLAARNLKTRTVEIRRVSAQASTVGCAAGQVAVEFEALFPHDGFR